MVVFSVEICVKNKSNLRNKDIRRLFDDFCKTLNELIPGKIEKVHHSLFKHIEYIQIDMKQESVPIHSANPIFYIFRNNEDGMVEECEETDDESTNVANTWFLPNKQFDGLYER